MHKILKNSCKKKSNQEMKNVEVGKIDLSILTNIDEAEKFSMDDNLEQITPSDFSPTEEDIAEVYLLYLYSYVINYNINTHFI